MSNFDNYFWIVDKKKQSYDLSESFYISRKTLAIYRIFAAIFLFFANIAQLIIFGRTVVIYITIWCFFLEFLYFLLISIETTIFKGKNKKFWKFIHIIFEISFSIESLVTIMYWLIIYPIFPPKTIYQFLNQALLHGGGYILLWVDNIFNKIRIYPKHMYFIAAYGFTYLFCLNLPYSLIYKPIYPPINWISFSSYIFLLLAIFLVFFHHLVVSKKYFDLIKKDKNSSSIEKDE